MAKAYVEDNIKMNIREEGYEILIRLNSLRIVFNGEIL
jgi:hypothetical protein